MVSSITTSTALSGLNAASTRLGVAANNIANANSTRRQENGVSTVSAFQPQEVVQTSRQGGGVSTEVRTKEGGELKVFDEGNPDADENGFVSFPAVDLGEQIVQTKLATYDFKANLSVLKVQDNLQESTLDILA